MNLIAKIRQILLDHKAMSMVRRAGGDVYLISIAARAGGFDYQCFVNQNQHTEAIRDDPARAITASYTTGALSMHRPQTVLTTDQVFDWRLENSEERYSRRHPHRPQPYGNGDLRDVGGLNL